jgi:hypothetical protein
MAVPIQLGGNLKLGPTIGSLVDYSGAISQMTISTTRESIAIPATLGTPQASARPGSRAETLTIQFHSDTDPTSVWAELWDAIYTDAAELVFEGNLYPGVTSTTNPKFSGTIRVMSLDTGGTVGSLRQQSQTYPVTEVGVVKAVA